MDNSHALDPRTRLVRHPERGVADQRALHAIIDEAPICHLAVALDGAPRVLPTMHARIDDTLYLHGARQNQLLMAALAGGEACLSFTLLDGLVLATRAMHHSMNYRSAVVYGRAREVTDEAEQRAALTALVERVGTGRAQEALPPSPGELAATLVVAIPLAEASVKVRAEGARAEPSAVPVYSAVIPLALRAAFPTDEGVPSPATLASVFARSSAEPRPLPGPGSEQGWAPAPADPHERREGELVFSSDLARLELTRVHAFLRDESYWAAGLGYEPFLRALLGSLCFGVYRGGRQLGFARVLHDGARFGWLADVFVFAEARGQGVGKALVAHVLGHPAVARLERVLLGTRDAHGLYARHGFQQVPDGRYMVKPRPR